MKKFAVLLLLVAMMMSCSGRPEEQIIGSWEFDRMEQLNGQQLDPFTQAMLSDMIGTMTMEFNDQGRCTTRTAMSIDDETGKYWLEDNGHTLVSKPDMTGVETRSTIISISRSELVLSSDGETALVFRKK